MQLTGCIPCSTLAAEVQLTLDSISALTEEESSETTNHIEMCCFGFGRIGFSDTAKLGFGFGHRSPGRRDLCGWRCSGNGYDD
jgi:hypothetical protein